MSGLESRRRGRAVRSVEVSRSIGEAIPAPEQEADLPYLLVDAPHRESGFRRPGSPGGRAGRRSRPKDPLDHEPEAVTYARTQAGLTKTQLAAACGVSLSLISEIEAGTRNATPATIIKLAEVLNCPRVVLERKRNG